MQSTKTKPPKSGKDANGALATKNGSLAAAAIAAAIAGLLIVVFLQQYRDSVNDDGVPTPVVVASKLIPAGTSIDATGSADLLKTVKVPKDQLKDEAVTDASSLRGKVAKQDVLPGQQITAVDFRTPGHGLLTKLGADERAITVSVDDAHGVGGNLKVGDHVDVLSGFVVESNVARARPVTQMLMQNVLVLDVPEKEKNSGPGSSNNQDQEVTLRVESDSVARLAFAADNGKIYLTLRPANAVRSESRGPVTLESVLGLKAASTSKARR